MAGEKMITFKYSGGFLNNIDKIIYRKLKTMGLNPLEVNYNYIFEDNENILNFSFKNDAELPSNSSLLEKITFGSPLNIKVSGNGNGSELKQEFIPMANDGNNN